MTKKKALRILLVDDHEIVRQGLIKVVDSDFSKVVYGEARNSAEGTKMAMEQEWDVIIMDINMPGRCGLDAIIDLRKGGLKTPILVLSMYPAEQFALRVIKAGASGYLTKYSTPTELVKAINTVLSGKEQYITDAITEILISDLRNKNKATGHDALSNRELEVMLLLGSGLSVSQIGKELSLSVKTISTHRSHILSKMDMKCNGDIILYSVKNQLIQ
jgi:two-component system invasion response regulator UvrY